MEEEKKKQSDQPGQEKPDVPVPNPYDNGKSNERNKLPKTPQSPFVPEYDEKKISEDIKQILGNTKLPERRQVGKQENGLSEKVFDTTLVTSTNDKSTQPKKEADTNTQKDGNPAIKSLRTFKDDLQRIVKVKKMSLVKAATLETEKKRGQREMTSTSGARSKSRTRVVGILFAVVTLVALGVLAIFVVITIQSQRLSDAPVVVQDNSFLFSEQTFTLPINGYSPDDLLRQMEGARKGVNLNLGAITRIVPTVIEVDEDTGQQFEREATTAEFFSALGTQAPRDFMRSFASSFFLGIHTVDENVPIIVLPVILYQNAFGGMYEWERYINEDLSPLFTKVPYQTTGLDGNISLNGFEDEIIRNYDVRALRDISGEVKMLYAFPTKEILIIAESTHSFAEALARLRSERRL